MRLNINENGVNIIWMVVNILIHLLTEILAYCKALKVKISVHSNFPYRFAHSVDSENNNQGESNMIKEKFIKTHNF